MNEESPRAAAPSAALAATLGLAAACWVITARLMDGMDMGIATRPGPFGFFAAAWVTMMAAMMLPGAALRTEAAAREGRHRRTGGAGAHRARARDRLRALTGSGPHAAGDVTTAM